MQLKPRLTAAARSDLEAVWDWVAERAGPHQARQVLLRISDAIDRLLLFPRMGRSRPEFKRQRRSLPVGEHVLIYRIEPGELLVERVLHGRRDLPRTMREQVEAGKGAKDDETE